MIYRMLTKQLAPFITCTAFLIVAFSLMNYSAAAENSVEFEKVLLSEEFNSEGADFADIDGDGQQDIVSGPYWYAGPDFKQRHRYAEKGPYSIKGYSDYFFTFVYDFNGDGRPDVLSIPMPGTAGYWHENSGKPDCIWKKHQVLATIDNESPSFTNLVGDERPELVCIHQGAFGYATPNWKEPTKPWTFTPVTPKKGYGRFTHGLGIGDVNDDGRQDLLETNGWWEQPAKTGELFKFHAFRFAQSGGSHMFAYDFDGDGDNDVISVQNAHAWGLTWFERRGTGDDFLFVPHPILTDKAEDNAHKLAISQMHAMALADIDGDGIKDIITGKRYWAHGGHDPGAQQLPVLYWFRTVRTASGVVFEPHLIDSRTGVGTQLTVADVTGNGELDILIGNKLGTFALLKKKLKPGDNDTSANKVLPLDGKQSPGAADFAQGVRNSEPLTPQQEKATFILPQGFEAQLVAAEPDIAKPLNMAFDAQGRIWVTCTLEYPYPVEVGKPGRDFICILEDTNGDGHADNVTRFADGLNIPMGLYPYGNGVICYSIPNILYLQDTTGDGKCDTREVLYGPFDHTRDTHGMCNGFTRGFDGWLYACHGFNNQSTVTGKDGNQVTMHSGNTFRMKLDGSRIEHFTHGQVNPFGMTVNARGDLFTADCHTKPVTLLLKDGHYDSFGKPHDGLGFVPNVMDHLHESTAIGGIALYSDHVFPEVYHGNTFGGNVMTSRINRNSLKRSGASVLAQEEPDFLIAGDSWFRPVDLQIGPDGALYVADFYNRIIGHYEVPLDHPGRDRNRGRIWKIVYTGDKNRRDTKSSTQTVQADITKLTIEQLIDQLASESLPHRLLVADRLADHFGKPAIAPAQSSLNSDNAFVRAHLLWVLHRLNALNTGQLAEAVQDEDPLVRTHAFRILEEKSNAADSVKIAWLKQGFQDADAQVRRAAVLASRGIESSELAQLLVDLYRHTSTQDVHLRHAVKMALRDQMKNEQVFAQLAAVVSNDAISLFADISMALKTPAAGKFVAENLTELAKKSPADIQQFVKFSAQYVLAEDVPLMVRLIEQQFGSDQQLQLQLLDSMRIGFQQRGIETPEAVRAWASNFVSKRLHLETQESPLPWRYIPHPDTQEKANCWLITTRRNSADGQKNSLLFSSIVNGERRSGVYHSAPFKLSESFSFYMAGHDGFTDKAAQGKNFVRVCDAQTKETLNQWSPKRNDTAHLFQWDTKSLQGRNVYVELVDGDSGTAYAWIAVGRFSDSRLNPSTVTKDRQQAAVVIANFRLNEFSEAIGKLIQNPKSDHATRTAFALAIEGINPDSRLKAVCELLDIRGLASVDRQGLTAQLLKPDYAQMATQMAPALKLATSAKQSRIAELLAADLLGSEMLLTLIESGGIVRQVLRNPNVKEQLAAHNSASLTAKAAQLTANLPPEDKLISELIATRKSGYQSSGGDRTNGAALFKKHCTICHQVSGQGEQVGPNLDGIGNRGLDRLLEDVLAPNRNVDKAFRSTTVVTDSGQVISGLIKPRDGSQLVIVNSQGKEVLVPKDEIEQSKTSLLSPMPANMAELLKPAEFADLIAYLLSVKAG